MHIYLKRKEQLENVKLDVDHILPSKCQVDWQPLSDREAINPKGH